MDLRIEPNDDPHLVVDLDPVRAYKPAPGELERRFEIQPDGHFRAVTDEGAVAGVASVATWPSEQGAFAWIYSMIVAPQLRGRGVGRTLLRHLLAHAQARGARTFALDATEEGAPLYASEGFAPAGVAERWRRPQDTAPKVPEGERRVSIYPISSCEVMDLWAYDKPRFGANRVPWLASAMARFPERTFVAFARATGNIVGYVESQERWIGPLVADDAHAAAWLLYAAERAGAPAAAINVPGNEASTALLRNAGYLPEGVRPMRMLKGGPMPGRLETQFLASGWALG